MMKRRNFLTGLAVLPLAQSQQSVPPRKRVVPLEVINRFGLRVFNGYGPYALGENGQPYDFDDVVAVLFELTREHWAIRK
jgi:hypothetical protein